MFQALRSLTRPTRPTRILRHRLGCIGLALWTLAIGAAAADDRATAAGKLAAARAYTENFLRTDGDASKVFFTRDLEPKYPARDFPPWDCGLWGLVRGLAVRGEPRFESAKQDVVLVPVVAELLMVEAKDDGGPRVSPDMKSPSWCGFDLERYDFAQRRFVPVPGFRDQVFRRTFKSWGPYMFRFGTNPVPKEGEPDAVVAIDLPLRYVRYHLRVKVSGPQPYRIWPQVPRMWQAEDAIRKLKRTKAMEAEYLEQGRSSFYPNATGDELSRELQRMRAQNQDRDWMIQQLQQRLDALRDIAPFSDLAP